MLNKQQQTAKKCRLRPKVSGKNKPKITDEDKEYLEYLQTALGYRCMVCGTTFNLEWHHVKKNSVDKKNHKRLIPLCVDHHRYNNTISAHNAPKAFREKYPIETQMNLAKYIHDVYMLK